MAPDSKMDHAVYGRISKAKTARWAIRNSYIWKQSRAELKIRIYNSIIWGYTTIWITCNPANRGSQPGNRKFYTEGIRNIVNELYNSTNRTKPKPT